MIKISIFFVLFLIFILPLLLSFLLREIPYDIQPSLEGTQIVYKGVALSQQFMTNMANLSGIGMSIKNPYFRNKKSLIVNLQSDDKSTIRSINLNGANVQDGDFMKIQFDPISDSAGKKYYLEIFAPDSESQESLEIFLTTKKPSWLRDLAINGEIKDMALSMVTYHSSLNLLATPTQVFTNWGKRFFADLPFAVIYSLLIIGLTGYLLKK